MVAYQGVNIQLHLLYANNGLMPVFYLWISLHGWSSRVMYKYLPFDTTQNLPMARMDGNLKLINWIHFSNLVTFQRLNLEDFPSKKKPYILNSRSALIFSCILPCSCSTFSNSKCLPAYTCSPTEKCAFVLSVNFSCANILCSWLNWMKSLPSNWFYMLKDVLSCNKGQA